MRWSTLLLLIGWIDKTSPGPHPSDRLHGGVPVLTRFMHAGAIRLPAQRNPQSMHEKAQTGYTNVMPNERNTTMSAVLQDRTIAILAADGVERVELEEPRNSVVAAGGTVIVLSIRSGEIAAREHDLSPAGTLHVDREVGTASVDDYDALVLPGGTVNPDKLRADADAVDFVRAFVRSGKPVAAICHGPWTLAEAGVLQGRTVTSYRSIRTDLRNAGAHVLDEELVIDHNLITSRSPEDLPAFCRAIVDNVAAASARR